MPKSRVFTDDLGPTTPIPARRTTVSSSQPEAGPSQPSKSKRSKEVAKVVRASSSSDRPATARKVAGLRAPARKARVELPASEDKEILEVSDDDEIEVPKPPAKKSKRSAKPANGTGASGVKAKSRPNAPAEVGNEAMEVESVEILEEAPVQPATKKQKRPPKTNPTTVEAERSGHSDGNDEMKNEIERLRVQVFEVRSIERILRFLVLIVDIQGDIPTR